MAGRPRIRTVAFLEKSDPEFSRIPRPRRPDMKKGRPKATFQIVRRAADQPFTLSLSALAMVIFTTLSASFLNCSPVAGLRTMRSGRSRQ